MVASVFNAIGGAHHRQSPSCGHEWVDGMETKKRLGSEKKTILELHRVTKTYRLDEVLVNALKGVDLKVTEGELVGIIGASGSGKSTMLNMIGVLDSPSEGSIIVDGTDVTHLDESAVARIRGKKIGFVFQAFNLSPTLSVYENIALPMRIHEFPDKEIAQKVEGLIRLVGLSHRVSHLPGQLSGGERQRVAIARALSTDPALLLADEPTGNLDTKTSMEIIRLFEDLNAKEGKTVVLVTHEPDIAAHCRRIVTMRDGLIVSDEPNAKRRVVS